MRETLVTCKSCGNHFQGRYCNRCGEKVYHAHDKKLSHFFEEAFHFITHFDSKFFRTFWLIFSKPGFVSKEYCEGKRKKYFSPISLFLIGVVLYLLFPLLQGMNISFGNHLANNNEIHFYALQRWAEHKVNSEHITLEALAEKFDHLSPKFSKVLLVVLIPLSALCLAMLFRRKRKYYFDHLMMAAEINSLFLFLSFIILPVSIVLIAKLLGISPSIGDTAFFLSLQAGLILLALILGFKRFYEIRFLPAILKAILFLAMYLLTLYMYRLLLFSVIMLFI